MRLDIGVIVELRGEDLFLGHLSKSAMPTLLPIFPRNGLADFFFILVCKKLFCIDGTGSVFNSANSPRYFGVLYVKIITGL